MTETISVIIPVYNMEQYLGACLDSIKAQTYSNLEIWLIDDGSVDNSGEICDEYQEKDPRFHVIHQENAGVSAARNTGIRAATGHYISFIDSDDWIEPDYYETMIKKFDQDIDMSMCCYCFNDGVPCFPMGVKEEKRFESDDALCFIISDKMSGPCNKLFLLEKIRERGLLFDPTVSVGEDMLFVFDYLRNGSMIFIPKALYHYRQTEGSLSRSDFKPSRMVLFDVLTRMEDKLQSNNISVKKAIRSKKAYGGMVSFLLLNTSQELPGDGDEIEKKLVKIIRSNLGELLKASGYSLFEKAATTLIAIVPRLGAALYRKTYMQKIKSR